MRHNRARLLLKVNKDNLYKHGWKQNVNYGPIRESIAASILHHSRFLEGSDERKEIRLWDPMCGSGTFGLVAATLLGNIPIRS
jgi:23S rRNA G2445 N2-methylase RlmL